MEEACNMLSAMQAPREGEDSMEGTDESGTNQRQNTILKNFRMSCILIGCVKTVNIYLLFYRWGHMTLIGCVTKRICVYHIAATTFTLETHRQEFGDNLFRNVT